MPVLSDLFRTVPLYPLRFKPIYKHYLWGGTHFRELFRRPIDFKENSTAESWEIADHPHGRSILKNGPLRGAALQDIVLNYPLELFGQETVRPDVLPNHFPLLFKYLDAAEPLSVQVHPDAETVQELQLNDREKTECWVIVDALPGSSLWIGTDKEYTKEELEQKIRKGNWKEFLNRVEVRTGDCFFIPAGTIHALGRGILVAEVQTASDLTFRLFDWNRLDTNGNPRELHLERGIRAIRTPTQPVTAVLPVKTKYESCESSVLVENQWFSVRCWSLNEPFLWSNDGHCHLWSLLEGSADAVFTAGRTTESAVSKCSAALNGTEPLFRGDTMLVPAVCRHIQWVPENRKKTILLDITVKWC